MEGKYFTVSMNTKHSDFKMAREKDKFPPEVSL
jgi:hypothetical protein